MADLKKIIKLLYETDSLRVNTRWVTQIIHLLYNPKYHYHVQKSPLLVAFLRHQPIRNVQY